MCVCISMCEIICCIRDVTLPLLLNSFVMKRAPSWRLKSTVKCSLIWQWRALKLFCSIGPTADFSSLADGPVRFTHPFCTMWTVCSMPSEGALFLFVLQCVPTYERFKTSSVWSSDVTSTAAPSHDEVSKAVAVMCTKGWFWTREPATLRPRCFARMTSAYRQAGGRKENGFIKDTAKALSGVALCYQMYF